jgi:hypothetical protein
MSTACLNGKLSAEQFHTGSGHALAMGLTTKILPPVGAGLEFQKTTSHTDDVIQKIKWRGSVCSNESDKCFIFYLSWVCVFIWSSGL